MPHILIEYSDQLAASVNMKDLSKTLARVAVGTGVFEIAGVRVRCHRVEDYEIADGHPDNAFLHAMVRVGHGRDLATRKAAAQTIFDALTQYLSAEMARRPLAISLEMDEIHPELNFKTGNIREYLNARAETPA